MRDLPIVTVDPRDLKPNPLRNFTLQPIYDDDVEAIRQSIKEHGYWGGVVCRRNKRGELEIACGHVRVRAAIKVGLKQIEVRVADFTDLRMLIAPARENALRGRGVPGTSLYGTVHGLTNMLMQAMVDGEPGELFPDQRTLVKTRQSAMKHRPVLVVRRIVTLLGPDIADEWWVKETIKTLQASGELGDPLMVPVEPDAEEAANG